MTKYDRARGVLALRRKRWDLALRRARYWRTAKKKATPGTKRYSYAGYMLDKREREVVLAMRAVVAQEQVVRDLKVTLAERAADIGLKEVGVMESGGNNRGQRVEAIIQYAQGQVPEAWCVDFVIWCYGHAGSTIVKPGFTRAVRFMWSNGVVKVSRPKRGDIVRFAFDHTGLFLRDLGDGSIETLEGNTGSTGARSDSATGGDGVYIKRRAKSSVQDYLRVTA